LTRAGAYSYRWGHEPPTVSIRSANLEYPNYERGAEEVNVVGRVVWTARRL
jgi:hypothetical protein